MPEAGWDGHFVIICDGGGVKDTCGSGCCFSIVSQAAAAYCED